jgi:hypothetical protein
VNAKQTSTTALGASLYAHGPRSRSGKARCRFQHARARSAKDAVRDSGVTDTGERVCVWGKREVFGEYVYLPFGFDLSSQSTVFHKVVHLRLQQWVLGSLSFSGPLQIHFFAIVSSRIYPQAHRPAYPHPTHTCHAWRCFHFTPSTPRVQTRTLACMTLCETWHTAQSVSIPPALSHTFDGFVRLAIALHASISHSIHAGGINVMSEVQSHVCRCGS